jgi:hypothetical protein
MPNLESASSRSSRAFSSSPLRGAAATGSSTVASQAAAFKEIDKSILARKVGLPTHKGEPKPVPFPNLKSVTEGSGADNASVAGEREMNDENSSSSSVRAGKEEEEKKGKLVSVSHVLTNVIVLQEFLLELAALVQVRAGLFGEVRFV